MKIIAYRKHPNGPDYFTAGWKNVKEFTCDGWEALPVARLINREIGPWAAEDIVRCEAFNNNEATTTDHIFWLDINATIWWSPPVTILAHYVTNVERALRNYEAMQLASNLGEAGTFLTARDALYKAENRLHNFILHTATKQAQDRAWAKYKEQIDAKAT
mgnify:CR=1 FL=1